MTRSRTGHRRGAPLDLHRSTEPLPLRVRYILAAVAGAGSVAGAEGLAAIDAPAVFAPVLLVVALAAWLLGNGPAVLTVVIGAAGSYLLVLGSPGAILLDDRSDLIGWAAFLLTAVAIVLLGAGLRSARRAAERESERSAFLAQAGLALESRTSSGARLQRLADLCVPRLADWCAIDIALPDGGVRLAAVAHSDPQRVAAARDLRERFPPDPRAATGVANVLRTGLRELHPVITDEMLVRSTNDPEQLAAARHLGLTSALLLPLKTGDRVLGVLTLVMAESSRALGDADVDLGEELARRAALAVDFAQLYEAEMRASRQLAGLQRVTAAVAAALTYRSVAEAVLLEGIPALGADAGVVAGIADDELRLVASQGYAAELVERWDGIRLDAPLPGPDAARTGQLVTIGSRAELSDAYPTLAAPGGGSSPFQATIAAPLVVEGAPHGFIGFNFADARTFDATEKGFVMALAQLAGVSLSRARAYDREHAVAQTLQRSLLPGALPTVEGLRLGARYVAAGEGNQVGGDFYDALVLDDEVLLVIGDICGQGVEAAALTALSRHTLRALAEPGRSPAELMRLLNAAVHRQEGPGGRFLTAAACVLRPSAGGWDVRACSAGHPLPLRIACGGEVAALGVPGMLIGPFPRIRVTEVAGRIEPGEALVLYTDGVIEARRGTELFGEERLRRVLSRRVMSPEGAADAIIDGVRRHRSGVLHDDVAVLVAVAEEATSAGT